MVRVGEQVVNTEQAIHLLYYDAQADGLAV